MGHLLYATLELIRFRVGLIVVFVAYTAIVIAKVEPTWMVILGVGLMLFGLVSGGFAFNDFFDVERDRINAPFRPIPSGLITRKMALTVSIAMFVISLFAGGILGTRPFLMTLVSLFLLIWYSYRIKRSRFAYLGNFVTALLCASVFFYGWAVGGDIQRSLFPALLTFLLIVGREVIFDIRDVQGDKKIGIRTLPIILGETVALRIALITLFTVILVNIIPFFLGVYNLYYFILVPVAVNSLLSVSIVILIRDRSKQAVDLVGHLTRVCFVVGAVGFLIG